MRKHVVMPASVPNMLTELGVTDILLALQIINSANNLCRISPGLNAFKKTMTTRAIKMMEPQGHRNSWEFIDWRTGYNIEIMLHLQLSDIQKQLTALTPASKAEGQKGEKEQQDPKIVKLSQQHEKVVQDLRMVIHLIAYMGEVLLHMSLTKECSRVNWNTSAEGPIWMQRTGRPFCCIWRTTWPRSVREHMILIRDGL